MRYLVFFSYFYTNNVFVYMLLVRMSCRYRATV